MARTFTVQEPALGQTGATVMQLNLSPGWALDRQSLRSTSPDVGATELALVDGVVEIRRMIRLQLQRGARCIKVVASGGVMSRLDDVEDQ